jgi:hypothetical protein
MEQINDSMSEHGMSFDFNDLGQDGRTGGLSRGVS